MRVAVAILLLLAAAGVPVVFRLFTRKPKARQLLGFAEPPRPQGPREAQVYQWRARDGTLGLRMGRENYTDAVENMMDLFREIEAAGRNFAFWDTPRAAGEPSLVKSPHLRIVTASSENHFEESVDLINSILRCNPGVRIEYYDIGLNRTQVDLLKRVTGVTYRMMDFSGYPPESAYLTGESDRRGTSSTTWKASCARRARSSEECARRTPTS
eukprot:Polyplicarium_translucidae@DN1000_c0_g1_i2.p1